MYIMYKYTSIHSAGFASPGIWPTHDFRKAPAKTAKPSLSLPSSPHTHTYTHTYTHTHINTHTCTCTYAHTLSRPPSLTHTHIYVYSYSWICITEDMADILWGGFG